MARKKVKLEFITNDSARKATFKKRKMGLMKKVNELSTLCGIEACAIVFSPYDSEPEVWPSPLGVLPVLSKFKEMTEMEQTKKMDSQESFLEQSITKANKQLKKQLKDNRENEMTQVMFQSLIGKGLHTLNMMDLNDLERVIEKNLKEIQKKFESLNNKDAPPPPPPQVAAPSSTVVAAPPNVMLGNGLETTTQVEGSAFEMNIDTMQREQWFMDLMNPQEHMMNPQEHMGFGDDEMMLPFGDIDLSDLWSSGF